MGMWDNGFGLDDEPENIETDLDLGRLHFEERLEKGVKKIINKKITKFVKT